VIVPVDVSAFLLNEKRSAVGEIEQATKVRVLIIPNPNMQTPHFEVIRLRDDEVEEEQRESYEIDLTAFEAEAAVSDDDKGAPAPQALVRGVTPDAPPPAASPAPEAEAEAKNSEPASAPETAPVKPGLFPRLWAALFAPIPKDEEPEEKTASEGKKTGERSGNKPKRRNNRQRKRPAKQAEADTAAAETVVVAETPASTEKNGEDSSEGEPKKRRRRGRRGGRRRGAGEVASEGTAENGSEGTEELTADVDTLTGNEAATTDAASSDDSDGHGEAEPRHRPSDKRSEGRRRRRRGPRTDNPSAEPATATEGTSPEVISASALSSVAKAEESGVSGDLFATVTSAAVVTEDDLAANDQVTKPAKAEEAEPHADKRISDDSTSEVAASDAPAMVFDQSGLTETGRAINDPRVEANPVTAVVVESGIRALFNVAASPDAVKIANNPARAANDPRGPRESDEPMDASSGENNAQEA
jgi:ribonuclease E